jgi:hypothetical protein
MITPLPWSSIPIGSTVLAPDGQPDVLLARISPLFVHLARSGMWGVLGHPRGLLIAVADPAGAPAEGREHPDTAAMRLIVEAFPTTTEVTE